MDARAAFLDRHIRANENGKRYLDLDTFVPMPPGMMVESGSVDDGFVLLGAKERPPIVDPDISWNTPALLLGLPKYSAAKSPEDIEAILDNVIPRCAKAENKPVEDKP